MTNSRFGPASRIGAAVGVAPLADWPAGVAAASLSITALVVVLLTDLATQGEVTIGGLGIVVLLAAAFLLSARLVTIVLAAAILMRAVSVVLGGVLLESAIAQIAAFVVVAGVSYIAADSMRHARKSADRADRLLGSVETAVEVAGASSSPQDWVEKLLVFSVQAVDADRGHISTFEADEFVVKGSFDRTGISLELGGRWKIEDQPLVGELIRTAAPTQGLPAQPPGVTDELARTVRRIRHYLLIPLLYEGNVHGMIALARFRDPAFSPEAVESVEQVARMASLALRSSRLYADLNAAKLDAERAMSRLADRERQLMDAQRIAHIGSYEYDAARDELTWSDEIYRIAGRDPAERTPSLADWTQYVHPDDRRMALTVVNEALRTGKPFTMQYRLIRPDGDIRDVQSFGRVVLDSSGRPAALAGTAQDITNLKRAEQQRIALTEEREEQLRLHARRMEALDRVKTEFLLLASHELRGPLSVLNGYVSLMQDGTLGDLPEPARNVLPIMSMQAAVLTGLIDEMLQTARLEQETDLDLEPLDLRDAVNDATTGADQLKGAEGRLKVDMTTGPVPVLADRFRLGIVLNALIDNALKYSAPRRSISCSVGAEGRSAVVAVRDRGQGIRAEDMPRLFTRFGRIVSPENAHLPGTGLGLYLAQSFAHMHGGAITVESEPGKGSTFELRIPLARELHHHERRSPVLAGDLATSG